MSLLNSSHNGVMYFGKLPLRADFVRSSTGSAVTQNLDRWISAAMERLSAHPDWKTHFDCAAPIDFAFCGPRSGNLLVGHMQSSRDSSGRRYPFLLASALKTEEPQAAIAHLPLIAAPVWNRMQGLAREVGEATDLLPALERLEETPLADEALSLARARAAFSDLLAKTNLGELERGMSQSGNRLALRSTVLASGLLLMPLLSATPPSGGASQGLALPIPANPPACIHAAALWMQLVAPFFARSDIELGVFITRLNDRPQLVLSLQGASPRLLEAIYNPAEAFNANIDMCEADWVEDHVDGDYALRKLSDYLAHPNLSLKQAFTTYAEVFLGA